MDIQKEMCKTYIQEKIRLAREEGIQKGIQEVIDKVSARMREMGYSEDFIQKIINA